MQPIRILKLLGQGIKRKVVDILSLDRMSEKYQVLAVSYVFMMLYTTLEGVFVNTLLYTLSGDLSLVILYRGITYVSSAVAMNLAAYLGQKKTPLITARTGSVIFLVMYIVLFAGLGHMEIFMIPVAILSGAGGGFYWSGHNVLVTHYTDKNNRDIGIAVLGIIQGVMTLCVPVVSGYVIALMKGNTGYRIMFGVGMAAVVMQVLIQRRLPAVPQDRHDSMLKLAVKVALKKTSVKLSLGYELLRGVREGTFAFIMNMLLFEIITDESLVGINTFVSGVASIAGSWVYGRFIRPHLRAQATMLVAAILTGTGLMLWVSMNVFTVMLFSLVSSFLTLFMLYACNNTTFDVLTQNDTVRKCMGELWGFREVAMATGRLLGLWLFTLFPQNQSGYVRAILLLNASQLLCGGIMWLAQRVLSRKRHRELTVAKGGGV